MADELEQPGSDNDPMALQDQENDRLEQIKNNMSDEEIIAGLVAILTQKMPLSEGLITEFIQNERQSISAEQIDQTLQQLKVDGRVAQDDAGKFQADSAFIEFVRSDQDKLIVLSRIVSGQLFDKI